MSLCLLLACHNVMGVHMCSLKARCNTVVKFVKFVVSLEKYVKFFFGETNAINLDNQGKKVVTYKIVCAKKKVCTQHIFTNAVAVEVEFIKVVSKQ